MTTESHQGHLTSSNKLEDQAASAALYSHKDANPRLAGQPLLDEEGRLSSAGAAMSLKYAHPHELPSFPSVGLQMSSAGAAASLADSNKKSFEHWKPGSIPAANKAAMLAKDYEMDPLWQPELSAAGSRAALLAHKDTRSPEIWRSSGTEDGFSAAGQALKIKSPNAIHQREIPADSQRKALMAATGAMSGSRPRAGSTPVKPAENSGSSGWALKAATKSHKEAPGSRPFASGDPGFEAARIQNMAKNNVNRQMYGSTPPVGIEVEEKNRQDTLRASAIAMAQKMYAIQQTHIDEAKGAGLNRTASHAAATKSHGRSSSDDMSQAAAAPPRYQNLEEAARKLAQERLAKLHDEHAEYRQYYGATSPPPRSRLSMRMRRRASTGGRDDDSSSDEEQSRRIKKQMSIFQSKLAEVDNKKRQEDRDKLLEAAHKNVEARMAKMDERIFQDTGKASPAQRELWERQAREKAQRDMDESNKNFGKVHIGGGKYLDQSEVDAIARARLQPTLDEISDKAEKARARDEEIRLEQERAAEAQRKEKSRQAEVKAEMKAAQAKEKQEQRSKRDEEKRVQKEQAAAEKEKRVAEKAAESERARLEREEKRKSREAKPERLSTLAGQGDEAAVEVREPVATSAVTDTEPIVLTGTTTHDQVTIPTEHATTVYSPTQAEAEAVGNGTVPVTTLSSTEEPIVSPTSPSKRDSKVKSWFKGIRGSGKEKKEEAPLRTLTSNEVDEAREDSIRNVAMAGRETERESEDLYGTTGGDRAVSPVRESGGVSGARDRSTSISSMSSSEGPTETAEVARKGKASEVPIESGAGQSSSRKGLKERLLHKIRPSKESKTEGEPQTVTTDGEEDEFEEARDTFEEKRLAPPPTLSVTLGDTFTGRPASPRNSHERSKFTEEL